MTLSFMTVGEETAATAPALQDSFAGIFEVTEASSGEGAWLRVVQRVERCARCGEAIAGVRAAVAVADLAALRADSSPLIDEALAQAKAGNFEAAESVFGQQGELIRSETLAVASSAAHNVEKTIIIAHPHADI